jgi:hypothetical protein
MISWGCDQSRHTSSDGASRDRDRLCWRGPGCGATHSREASEFTPSIEEDGLSLLAGSTLTGKRQNLSQKVSLPFP